MAALYLHNALHTPEAFPPHSRAHSNSTLRTSTTSDTHPTEPLLHGTGESSSAYREMLSRQPTHPGAQTSWDISGLDLAAELSTARSVKGHLERMVKRKLKRLKWSKGCLQAILGGWATYNAVRYFIAYTVYVSTIGGTVALVLGASTTLSLALMLAAALLPIFKQSLVHHLSAARIVSTRTVLHRLAAFFLLAPSLVSFALLFVWRNSGDHELRPTERCALDIDIVWAITRATCDTNKTASWGVWVAFASTRIAMTLAFIIGHQATEISYRKTRANTRGTPFRRHMTHLSDASHPHSHHRNMHITNPMLVPHVLQPPSPPARLRAEGETTVRSRTPSLRRGSPQGGDSPQHSPAVPLPTDTPTSTHDDRRDSLTSDSSYEGDADLLSFVDRFRSLVNQISRETEDAVHIATRPEMYSHPSYDSYDSYDPYDEFGGRPETVRVLGRDIRRMSTIESFGSREMSSPVDSYHGGRGGGGGGTGGFGSSIRSGVSRPPTRMATLSDSEPPTRSNSLVSGNGLSRNVWASPVEVDTGEEESGGERSRRSSLHAPSPLASPVVESYHPSILAPYPSS